ncbi:INO80 complex subunit C [Daphnia magna]|uniref:INO80 complex subunit C n=1 Tax=Daphnia magna TaxID=35525 RepID=UPI001E1BC877|nr:INO80 complex subunit C [Daphnia magna]
MMAKKKKTSIISKKNEVSSTTTVRTETFLSKKTEAASPLLTCVDGTLDEAYLDEMKNVPFKNTCYEAKKTTKRKIWKGLKQILSQERSMECASDAVFYSSIDAPPSFKPAKKYSDLSGLLGNYTDPHTHLRYAEAEEYQTIQTLPSDIVSGYLTLRKALNPVG